MNKYQKELAPANATGKAGIGERTGLSLDLAINAARLLEFLLVMGSGVLAILVIDAELSAGEMAVHLRVVFIMGIAFAVLAESLGCYDLDAQFSLQTAWRRVAASWTTAALFMLTLGFILKASEAVSRGWAGSWFLAGGAVLLLSRAATTIWFGRLKMRGAFNQRVAIFGAGPQGERFADYVQSHDRLTISLIGFFDDRRDGRVTSVNENVPMLGNLSALVSMIRDGKVDQVVVALPWSAEERLKQIVSRLALTPVKIRLAPDLASFAFARRPIVLLGDVPMITLFERPISGLDAVAKLIEDKVLTVLILLVLGPVMAIIALAIKLDSPGPVFFRQPREGFNNKPFKVFKFRTMYHDRSQIEMIQQAQRADPRVTRIGRYLRKASLDELPQLFNVMTGDMSLVGPRPHAASTRAGGRLFSDVVASYAARHKVKPGITGWAQVSGWRGETDTEEKLVKRLEHDLYYIENWAIWFDFYILFRTIGSLLVPKNAF